MKRAVVVMAIMILMVAEVLAGNYTLRINGKEIDLDVGEETTVLLPDGRKVTLLLNQKDVVRFTSDSFTFEHKSALTPTRTKLDQGIYQTMMASPRGTVVMIQEYNSMNPIGLIDLMLRELTKEEVQYGYKYTESPIKQTLSDGTTLTGKKAVTTYKGGEWSRSVLSYGTRDTGVLIITAIEKTNASEDADIIDRFWKSLKLMLK